MMGKYIEVRVRLSQKEKTRLIRLAEDVGISLSDYVRRAIDCKAQLDATVRKASEGVQ